MTEPVNNTRIATLAGRDIVVRPLKDLQLLLMSRDAEVLADDKAAPGRKLKAASFLMEAFESTIVGEGDLEYVQSAVRRGEIDLEALLTVMQVFREEAPAKPVVKRGRPRKAA